MPRETCIVGQTEDRPGHLLLVHYAWCEAEPWIGLYSPYIDLASVSILRGDRARRIRLVSRELHERITDAITNNALAERDEIANLRADAIRQGERA